MRFDAPRALSFTPDGTLLLVESGGNRVSAITPDGEYMPIAGAGDRGFAGDGGPALDALLSSPMDVIAAANGSLFVADFGNNRLRKLERPSVAEVVVSTLRVVHGATGGEGPFAAGQIVTVSGLDFARTDIVRFGDEPGTVLHTDSMALAVVVPPSLRGADNTFVIVKREGKVIGAANILLTDYAPGLFPLIRNADDSDNSPDNPAPRGTAIMLRATGVQADSANLRVLFGPYLGEIVSAAVSDDEPGVVCIKVRVPAGFIPAGQLPLTLRAGDTVSPPGVTVTID